MRVRKEVEWVLCCLAHGDNDIDFPASVLVGEMENRTLSTNAAIALALHYLRTGKEPYVEEWLDHPQHGGMLFAANWTFTVFSLRTGERNHLLQLLQRLKPGIAAAIVNIQNGIAGALDWESYQGRDISLSTDLIEKDKRGGIRTRTGPAHCREVGKKQGRKIGEGNIPTCHAENRFPDHGGYHCRNVGQ